MYVSHKQLQRTESRTIRGVPFVLLNHTAWHACKFEAVHPVAWLHLLVYPILPIHVSMAKFIKRWPTECLHCDVVVVLVFVLALIRMRHV